MKTEDRVAKGLPVDSRPPRATDGEKKEGGGFKGPRKGGPNDKFNAFRELEKMRKGLTANIAPIPEGVEIVGKAIPVSADSLKRRRDDKDDESKPPKQQKTEVRRLIYVQCGPYADDSSLSRSTTMVPSSSVIVRLVKSSSLARSNLRNTQH